MRFAAKSEQGKRIQNEDQLFIPTRPGDVPLAVVADGMGGHNAGSTASTLAVEVLWSSCAKGALSPSKTGSLPR